MVLPILLRRAQLAIGVAARCGAGFCKDIQCYEGQRTLGRWRSEGSDGSDGSEGSDGSGRDGQLQV